MPLFWQWFSLVFFLDSNSNRLTCSLFLASFRPRKSSLPVRCVPLTASGGRTVTVTEGQVRKAAGGLEGDTGTGTCSEEAKYSRKLGDTKCKEVFKFDQEEEVKKPQPKSETNFAGKIRQGCLLLFSPGETFSIFLMETKRKVEHFFPKLAEVFKGKCSYITHFWFEVNRMSPRIA